ncbi:hypothetical protein ACFL2Q_10515 [Thermodesulfobacteriota bacterium]
MHLNAPKEIVWWISFALCLLGILGGTGILRRPVLQLYLIWIPIAGLVLLLLATYFPGI